MRYYKTFKDNGEQIEIDRGAALQLLESGYINVDQLIDTPARYPLAFSILEVIDDSQCIGE